MALKKSIDGKQILKLIDFLSYENGKKKKSIKIYKRSYTQILGASEER